ncbi:unnamed protein product [Prunus armeniaca]
MPKKLELTDFNWVTKTPNIRYLDGLWVEGDILPNAFIKAFKLRFTAEQAPNHHLMFEFLQVIEPCVTSSDNENLLAPVSDFELECAIKSIKPLKAPGPDGLHDDINHTNIALIPKVASPESVNHFRPISLCTVSYKLKKGSRGARAIKLDLEKAYDLLDWEYIRANSKMMTDRIRSKFAGWKAQTLSRAGRLTLIKASVSGIPNHTLSCFKCPKEVCKEMNSCCIRFFWGNGCKVPPIAWKDICLPQSLGGLGVRSATHFNKAALAKLGWICLNDSSNWWAQIMAKKYLKKDCFL